MSTQILTESPETVNSPTGHTFIKASDGSILAGASLADILAHQASHSHKIKLFDTYSKQTVKFYNGSIKAVDLEAADYEQFVSHLQATGWTLRPQVTSGGYMAVKGN